MEWSKYNYIFKSKNSGYLLYNALTNSFAEINDVYATIKDIKKNPDNINDKNCELIEQLKEAKILVESNEDEFINYKFEIHSHRFYNQSLLLTIAPTMDCNFRCSYCYEEGHPLIYLNDETEKNLLKFIESYNSIKSIHITWFGGEPLMAFDRICSITEKILQLNISYTASMITNGYLLDDNVINNLVKLKISKLQITLDGLETVHNQRRPHVENSDSFNKILSNLDNLFLNNNNIYVGLRVNIDKFNQDEYLKVYELISQRFKKQRISVGPGFVTQKSACSSISDCDFNRDDKVDFTIEQYRKNKINSLEFYPSKKHSECGARNVNSFVVGPQGELYKCWHDIGNLERAIGNLNLKGITNSTLLTRYLTGADPFDDEKCRNCFYLPVCGGGCPLSRLDQKYLNPDIDTCSILNGNLDRFLEIHKEIVELNNEEN